MGPPPPHVLFRKLVRRFFKKECKKVQFKMAEEAEKKIFVAYQKHGEESFELQAEIGNYYKMYEKEKKMALEYKNELRRYGGHVIESAPRMGPKVWYKGREASHKPQFLPPLTSHLKQPNRNTHGI